MLLATIETLAWPPLATLSTELLRTMETLKVSTAGAAGPAFVWTLLVFVTDLVAGGTTGAGAVVRLVGLAVLVIADGGAVELELVDAIADANAAD